MYFSLIIIIYVFNVLTFFFIKIGFSHMLETYMFCMTYTTQNDLNECTVQLVIRHICIPLQIEIVMFQET